jgi:hypothetical protein
MRRTTTRGEEYQKNTVYASVLSICVLRGYIAYYASHTLITIKVQTELSMANGAWSWSLESVFCYIAIGLTVFAKPKVGFLIGDGVAIELLVLPTSRAYRYAVR